MYLTIRGLVLRVTDYNDRDALLTVLTQSHGKLTVKARGLRRRNSPISAVCQVLCLGEFTLFEYRGMYTINEAAAVELFLGLRKDLQKLSLGTYFAQVAEVISQEDTPNPALLSLVLNCLYALSRLNLPEQQIKAAFELRAACLAGYTPELSGCSVCGNPVPNRFDVSAGKLLCSECRGPESPGIRMPVSPGSLAALRYLVSCAPQRLLAFRLPPDAMEQLSQLTESYLSTQLERGFPALDFYKSLLITPAADIPH